MVTNTAFAQKGVYVNLNTGYNFSLGSGKIGENTKNNSTGSSFTNSREAVNGSLGKGMSLGVAFGYMLSDHIGMELGFSNLIGGTTELTLEQTFHNFNGTGTNTTNSTTKISANMLQLNPSVVISAGKAQGLKSLWKVWTSYWHGIDKY